MKKQILLRILALTVALALLLAGCATPAANQATVKPGAADTPKLEATATDKAASAEPTAAETVAPQAAASSAFKIYGMIDIGMTKDEVDKKLGITPKPATGEYDPPDSYYYQDDSGEGVYVIFTDKKLTNKTVQCHEEGAALAPYTSQPVTQAQCDKITDGMPHADVDKLLGSKGAECSKSQFIISGKASVSTIWRWGNKDGSFLQVVFVDGDTAKGAQYFER